VNEKVKAILQIGKVVAPLVFPPSGPAIAVLEKFVKHEGDVADNVADAQAGGLYVSGAGATAYVGGSIFTRNVMVMMEAAIKLMHDSVKEPQA